MEIPKTKKNKERKPKKDLKKKKRDRSRRYAASSASNNWGESSRVTLRSNTHDRQPSQDQQETPIVDILWGKEEFTADFGAVLHAIMTNLEKRTSTKVRFTCSSGYSANPSRQSEYLVLMGRPCLKI